jgi:polysaccharide chain length determinant protein (PEP-CTERM system associated)
MIGHREMGVEDYLAILRRRFWWLAVPLAVGPVLGLVLTAVLPAKYTSRTLVLVEQQSVPEDFVRPVVNDQLNERLGTMREQILSRSRLQPIIERFGLFKEEVGHTAVEDLVARLRGAVVVTPVQSLVRNRNQDVPGFSISVTLNDGRLAQQVCAEITAMFVDENLKQREKRAENTTDFLDTQLKEAKSRLDEQDRKLAAFKQRYVGQLPGQEQGNWNLLMSTTAQLEANTQALNRALQDKTYLDTVLSQRLAAWEASKAGGNPVTLEQQLDAMKSNLATLEGRYTPDHPDVVKARAEIAQVESKIAQAKQSGSAQTAGTATASALEPADIQQIRAQIHNQELTIKEKTAAQGKLQDQIRTLQARVQLSPVVEQQFKDLTRDYTTAQQGYDDLLRKRTQSEIATNLERRQQGEQFRMVDPANLPEKPSFPDRLLFAGGGLGLGLATGIGLVLLLEFRDKTLRTEGDVEVLLGVPTLAMMPVVQHSHLAPRGKGWRRKLQAGKTQA